MAESNRPLPQNLEAERSVLGAIFIDNKYLPVAMQHLKSSDFFLPQNRVIFREMLVMADAQQPIDPLTLQDRLSGKAQLNDAGGPAYLSSLLDGIPRITNVEEYAKIVAEKSRQRQLAFLMASFQSSALEGERPVTELLNELDRVMRDIKPASGNGNGNGHLSMPLMDFLKEKFPEPDHLVIGLVPRGGTILILALPHRMKSWFTTALALASSRAGTVLGNLVVPNPVRTILVQVEDFPGQLQWRIQQLLRTQEYTDIIPDNVRILPRCDLNLMDDTCFQKLLRETAEFRADHVIIDVVRRVFRGDVNSPKESAAFLEQIDRLREATNCAVTLVHHENKKDAELMTAAAGSYNFPGWANVMIQFKRKTMEGHITHVEIEVDNKLAQSPEPMRMVLDLTSELPVRVEALEDGVGTREAEERLGSEWTVRDLAEALEVHKANAQRRLKKWIATGSVEKVCAGKRGRTGGLARYRFLDPTDNSVPDVPPVHIRRIN